MPLFDIECRKCKRIHEVVAEWQDVAVVFNCSGCNNKYHDMLAPLTAMHPDNMWSGTDTRFGHFTSKSQYNQLLKERNIVTVDKKELDTVKKNVYNAKQDKLNKLKKNVNEYVEKELTNVEISPDGNTIKERNKYVRKRQ